MRNGARIRTSRDQLQLRTSPNYFLHLCRLAGIFHVAETHLNHRALRLLSMQLSEADLFRPSLKQQARRARKKNKTLTARWVAFDALSACHDPPRHADIPNVLFGDS